jgi:hypothetical protein
MKCVWFSDTKNTCTNGNPRMFSKNKSIKNLKSNKSEIALNLNVSYIKKIKQMHLISAKGY